MDTFHKNSVNFIRKLKLNFKCEFFVVSVINTVCVVMFVPYFFFKSTFSKKLGK